MNTNEDYLLKVKVQNNRIVSLMREKGHANVAEFSRGSGIGLTLVHGLINMTASPYKAIGGWRDPVIKMADYFGVLPDEMFNYQQRNEPLKINNTERAVKVDEVVALMSGNHGDEDPVLSIEHIDSKRVLVEVLGELNPREKKIIEMRFGLGGEEPLSQKEVGKAYGINGRRIAQIEGKALRKLRQPRHADKLKEVARCDLDLA